MKRIIFSLLLALIVSILCVSALAAETTIYVSASGDDTAIGTAQAPIKSLYAAFRALPYGGTIVVCDEIPLESTEFPTSKGLVTITSVSGDTDYRSTSDACLEISENIYLKSAVKFENIDFKFSKSNINFICNGNYVCFGEGLTFTPTSSTLTYPLIVVGSIGLVGSDGGYAEIHSGTYSRIYGGAIGVNSAPQRGDTTIAIYGGTFNNTFYMTGITEATGNVNIYIYGGTFNAGLVGAASSDISGNLYVSVYGGTFNESDSYIRPATNGKLSGNCTFNILGGNLRNVYNIDSGSITGNLKIKLASGITPPTCPFETSYLSNDALKELKTTDTANLTAAKDAKYPEYAENPLISRKTTYKGITPKATSFIKDAAGGDLNGDGQITLADTLKAFKSMVGINYNASADINEDKIVSVSDALTILQKALSDGNLITEYPIENNISKNLIRYGDAIVTDNKMNTGYIFGTISDPAYTLYSKVKFEENGIVGLYFGCSSSSPSTANGYYFEANAADSTLTVYRIENFSYRKIAEKQLALLSDEAVIKVTYGASSVSDAVQFYFNDNPLITDHYFDFDLVLDKKGNGVGMYVENATATIPVAITESVPENTATYQNYIIPTFTDPEIYYENGTYYIYGTKSGGLSGVICYTTTDFVTFTALGEVLTVENGFGDKSVTAANIVKYGDVYYMFYIQESNSLGYSTTGYVTSTSPAGPFTNSEKVPLTNETDLIGGQPFIDDDGTAYLVYTRTTGGNRTYISKLILDDGKAELDLTTETLLLEPSAEWEYAKASVLECGFIVKHDGTYYLIYAGGNYNSTYGVGYATADNIYGPYTKYARNPIMWSNDQAFGNGAASVFVSPDTSEHFIIYLRNNSPTTARPLNTCIDRIRFVPNPNGGADILEIAGASVTPQALPSGIGSTYAFDYQAARWHW